MRERLTYANVMATIAVFGVLAGGGAYAASQIGPKDIARNAVRSKHIQSGNVKRSDLAANAVASPQVAGDSLNGSDIIESSLGKVASATSADSATTAASATSAGSATTAGSATHADDADHATSADNAAHADDADHATSADNAATVDTVVVARLTLVQGDVSDAVVFERGDWRITAVCNDPPDSGFPEGVMRLRYMHADDGTVASMLGVSGQTFNLVNDGSSAGSGELIRSAALVTGGHFFASDDFSAIRGLASIRIPTRSGAYSGPDQCQFEVTVLG